MKTYLFISFTILELFFLNCNQGGQTPCPAPDTVYCKFGSSDLINFPNLKHDTLKLRLDTIGNDYVLISHGSDTGIAPVQYWIGECPPTVQNVQTIFKKFSDSSNQRYIRFSASSDHCYANNNVGLTFGIDLNGDFMHIIEPSFRPPYAYDSLIVNGKLYLNIKKSYRSSYDTIQYVLYNSDNGIIQINMHGKKWSILP